MDRTADLAKLKSDEWDQLQDLADAFEEAWRKEGTPDINRFLPAEPPSLRAAVLQELIKTDLEFRWKARQQYGLEFYLEKFPELGNARTITPQLIYEEYRVRQMYGDRPPLISYKNRYSDQFEKLEELIKAQPVQFDVTQDAVVATPSSRTEEAPHHTKPPQAETPKAETPKAEPAKAAAPKKETTKKGKGKKDLLHVPGGYKLVKRIGSGGFGEVWRGLAPGDVEVAVKLIFRPIDHEEAQRERQSLELIKALRHPFLLQTQSFWTTEDRLYIVMELAEGSLRDRLKECRKQGLEGVPLKELVTYFRESAEALDFLHEHHVLHRDVKPENILVLQRHAKVADFGLARVQESQRMVSATGSGTPLYMAPEVWRGKASIHSDQYSLAMAFAELRLDRRICSGKDMMQIMFDHMERTPELNPLPEAEQQVLLKAMHKDPEQRYANCREFMEALERAVGTDQSLVQTPVGMPVTTPGRLQRSLPADGMSTIGGTEVATGAGTLDPSRELTAPLETGALPRQTGGWRGSATMPLPEAPTTRRWPWVAVGMLLVCLVGAAVAFFRPTPQPIVDPNSKQAVQEKPWLPEGCEAAPDAKTEEVEGRPYYTRIMRKKNGLEIPFVLIPKTGQLQPPTFYMMENKVTNEQFLAAVKDEDFTKLLSDFATKYPGTVLRQWEKKPFPEKGNLPVFSITVTEAHCYARWLGGFLPSEREWLKASGYLEPADKRGEGPYHSSSDPGNKPSLAIDREGKGPLPVGEAKDDVNIFGCHDMAGNGYEWTRSVYINTDEVPLQNLDDDYRVIVEGHSYEAKVPWQFKDVNPNKVDSEPYKATLNPDVLGIRPDLGFRVVLEQ